MVLSSDTIHERLAAVPLQSTGAYHRLAFRAMGTECRVDFAAASVAAAREFQTHVLGWLADFESRYSRFLPDSLITRINVAAGKSAVEVDGETEALFRLCDWYHWLTKGVFDPTSLPLQLLWDYHRPQAALPSDADVVRAKSLLGWRDIQRTSGSVFLPRAGMAVDLGGIGKEYAVDRTIEMARARGITNILVDYGHDVRASGSPPEGGPWRIGLEDPRDPGKCWGGIALNDRAVCTSGNYLRFVEINGHRYGHIVDPRSGYPVANGTLSVSVIAPTCTEAGILTTAAYILGANEGVDFIQTAPQAEGCVWTDQGCHITGGFQRHVIIN